MLSSIDATEHAQTEQERHMHDVVSDAPAKEQLSPLKTGIEDNDRVMQDRSPARSRSRSRQRSPPRDRRNRPEPEPSTVLGIFGLSTETREETLQDIFGQYGPIDKIMLILDRYTRESRGFGFVYFKDVDSAVRARDATNGMDIDRRAIRVDYSLTKKPHDPTPGMYMGEDHQRSRRRRDGSRSPVRRRQYSRSPVRRRQYSRSPVRRRRDYSRSPVRRRYDDSPRRGGDRYGADERRFADDRYQDRRSHDRRRSRSRSYGRR